MLVSRSWAFRDQGVVRVVAGLCRWGAGELSSKGSEHVPRIIPPMSQHKAPQDRGGNDLE